MASSAGVRLMWPLLRTVVVAVLGDDIVKYVLYVLGGIALVVYLESTAAIGAIEAQPWGQWWLVGVGGGGGSQPQAAAATSDSSQITLPPSIPLSAPVPTLVPAVNGDRIETLINNAMAWMGTRYLWSGCTKNGVDCSCFVMNALATIGIHAPRVTVDQIRWAAPISASEARAGDLVFFDNTCTGCGANPTHVGLYLGGGRMADCGDPCRVEAVYGGHNARYGRPPGL